MNQNSNNHEKEPTNEGGFWSRFGFSEKQESHDKKDESQEQQKPEEPKQEEKKQPPKDDLTEKLTKEEKAERKRAKRRRVVSRSRSQVADADRKDPYRTRTYSPIERVSLALAERIVRLDTRLQTDESLDDADITSIEYAIDFMGLMTDKLEDPQSEAAPEVDAAIAVLLEPLVSPQETIRLETNDEVQENLAADVKDIVVAIASTQRDAIEPWLLLGKGEILQPPAPDSNSGDVKNETRPELRRIDPEQILETANDYRRMVPTVMRVLKKERRKQQVSYGPGPGIGLAAAGATAATVHEAEEHDAETEQPASVASRRTTQRHVGGVGQSMSTKQPEANEPLRHVSEPSHTEESMYHRAQTHQRVHDRPSGEGLNYHESENPHVAPLPDSISKKRPEELSLRELLHEAEHISVGHGMYLRQAFERGEIDQKGLVDVIKSKRKGRDFRQEFSLQKQSFARKKRESPEFLHQSESTMSQQNNSSGTPAMSDLREKIAREPLSAPMQSQPTNAQATQTPDASSTDHRKGLLGDILSRNQDEKPRRSWGMWLALGLSVAAAAGLLMWLF